MRILVDVDRLSWDFRFPVTALPGSNGSRPAKTSPIPRGCTTCAVEKVGLVVKANEPKTIAVLSQYCTDKPKWMFHVYLFCLHVFTLVCCLIAFKSFTYAHIIQMCTVLDICIIYTSRYIYGHIHICMYIYIHICTYTYIYIYRAKYVFICLYMYYVYT